MKTITSIIVGAALLVPSMATAQRWTTPGTHDRHEANLAKTTGEVEVRADNAKSNKSDRRADNDASSNTHINGAKAGRVNLAKKRSGEGA